MQNSFILVLSTTLLLFFSSSLYLWLRAAVRRLEGRPLLPLAPRFKTPWDYAEILMAIGMLILGIIIVQRTMLYYGWVHPSTKDAEMPVDEKATLMLGFALVQLTVMGFVAYWTSKRIVPPPGPTPYPNLYSKVRVGVAAGLMLIPPSLLIQILVHLFQPYQHDLLDMVTGTPSVKFFLIAGFTAVIVAPIAEEIFFRMLLQGWLESIQRKPTLISQTSDARNPDPYAIDPMRPVGNVKVDVIPAEKTQDASLGPLVMYVPSTAEQVSAEPSIATPPYWPILVSATLFALMHWGQGLAPISLFFLSLGLGYLYRQTHSVIPSVVVHFMLNGFSMLMVLGATLAEPAKGPKEKPVGTPPAVTEPAATDANRTSYQHSGPNHLDANHRVVRDV